MAALALAPAEASSTLDLTGSNVTLVVGVAVIAVIALAMGFVFRQQVLRADTGTDKMREIGAAVEEGAQAYLTRQFKTLAIFVVLVFGHLFINLIAGEGGVKAIDFGFVAGKWASPFWQVYDTLLLWLALIHGSNGMRTIVNDYVAAPTVRRVILGALVTSSAVLLILGTLVVWTFDPCPAGAPADLLPSFCAA